MKIDFKKIKPYLYLSVVVIIVSSFVFTFTFLYENFYQVITQSEQILVLQKQVAFETIDIEKFNKILERMKEKNSLSGLPEIKNPFE